MKSCWTVVACYEDDDNQAVAVRFGMPADKSVDDLEEYLYDCGWIYVDIQEDTITKVPDTYTDITDIEYLDAEDYGYEVDEFDLF